MITQLKRSNIQETTESYLTQGYVRHDVLHIIQDNVLELKMRASHH